MLKSEEDFIGIEIEVECDEGYRGLPKIPYWNLIEDGSLRNGGEYVLRNPCKGERLLTAIQRVSKSLGSLKTLRLTSRTSTHIHCDIRDLAENELEKFIDLLFFFELDLLNTNKRYNRRRSNFCYALNDVELGHFTKENAGYLRIGGSSHWTKYTSINLRPICSLGTIEFRGSEAVIKTGELLRAVNRILVLKNLARSDENRWELLERVANTHPRKIFGSAFRKDFKFSNSLDNYIRVIELREGV